MLNGVIGYLYLVFCTFVIFISIGSGVLYFLQLEEYNKKSILKSFFHSVKENYLSIILYLIILFFVSDLKTCSDLILLIYLNLECVLLVLLGNKFKYINKIKYTKRMLRILSLMLFLFCVYQVVFCNLFSFRLLILIYPTNILLAYLFVFVAVVILFPIEKKISNYYLFKAKSKLDSMKHLIKIGITGSYGKTSTKEILYSIVKEKYFVLATEKSFNTPNGISLTINNKLTFNHEIFICEMGAKKRGEILDLCKLVNPDIGVVVSVGRQHLNTFGSIENVYSTKKELPDFLKYKKCVFNLNNKYSYKMFSEYIYDKIGVFVMNDNNRILNKTLIKNRLLVNRASLNISLKFFIISKLNLLYAKKIGVTENGLHFNVYYNNSFLFEAKSSLIGIHNITNILLAIGVGLLLNIELEKIRQGIDKLSLINARLQKINYDNGAILINNGYNSNLDTVKFSLKTLLLFDRKNKVVVTPGLVDCLDQYLDNFEFAKIIAKVATKVYIVGLFNRNALLDGLLKSGFHRENIVCLSTISEIYEIVRNSDNSYVYLIENDLPDNYR